MSKEREPGLDNVLARPKRLAIAALLYLRGPTTMAELRRALGMSWGDLDSNLRALREAGYVEVRKIPTLKGPRTMVTLTQLGRKRFEETVDILERIIAEVRRARKTQRGPQGSGSASPGKSKILVSLTDELPSRT